MSISRGFPPGTLVGVIDPNASNFGHIGTVVNAWPRARSIPDGWQWVKFGSHGHQWWCEYEPSSLVSIMALGNQQFRKMVESEQFKRMVDNESEESNGNK